MNHGKTLAQIPIDKIYIGMNVITDDKNIGIIKYVNKQFYLILIEWDFPNFAPVFDKHCYLTWLYYHEK